MTPTILTWSGKSFDFTRPHGGGIDIFTIAHALSQLCRFTGHTRSFYSVAQHSVAVSHLVPAEHALAGLLHDAAEAYIGDVSAPLKMLLPDYKAIERRVEAAVLAHFGIGPDLHPSIKRADLIMLATEQVQLMPVTPDIWSWQDSGDIGPLDEEIVPLDPVMARRAFMNRFAQLTLRHPT
ncbi:MAG: hypothetical protein RL375_2622 [Pseudomonadota bacterium]